MSAFVVMAWLDPESWEPVAVFDHEPTVMEAAIPALRVINSYSDGVRDSFDRDGWRGVYEVRAVPFRTYPDPAVIERAERAAAYCIGRDFPSDRTAWTILAALRSES